MSLEINQNRGRPKGHQSYAKMSVLISVAQIAARYGVGSELLLDAFAEAWMRGKSRCEGLEIECRNTGGSSPSILISCEDKVVWQFPVEAEILREPQAFKSSLPVIAAPLTVSEHSSARRHIGDLRAGMKEVAVAGRVREVPPKRLVNTKYGFEVYVSNILLSDGTGVVRLSLWNEQIDGVTVGDTVSVENASASMFQGQLQLRLGKGGKMSIDASTRESHLA